MIDSLLLESKFLHPNSPSYTPVALYRTSHEGIYKHRQRLSRSLPLSEPFQLSLYRQLGEDQREGHS